MVEVSGRPADRGLSKAFLYSGKDESHIAALKVTAAGPSEVWDAIPEGLKNARKGGKSKDSDPEHEALVMAGQFAKVSTSNPLAHEFLDKRIVRINGPIDEDMAANVIAMMQLLDDLAPNQDIELRINSPGGSITAGLAIYDAMKNLNCDVKTVCEGEAMSMAAFLLATGTPGKRASMPNSSIMVHGPSGGYKGTSIDMAVYMKEMQRLKDVMVDLFSQHTGLSKAQLEGMMERDTFLTAADSKALGLIDTVIEPRHKPPFPKNAKPAGPIPPLPPSKPSPQPPVIH